MDDNSNLIIAILLMVGLLANGLITGSVWAQHRLIMQPVKRFLVIFAKADRQQSPINYWLIMAIYAILIICCL